MTKALDFLTTSFVSFFRPLFDRYQKSLKVREINNTYSPLNYCDTQPAIYLFWHTKNLCLLPYTRHPKFRFLTANNFIHRFTQRIAGIQEINRLPCAIPELAPLQIRDALSQGLSIGIAADGPYGTKGKLKRWIVHIAKQTQTPIIAIDVASEKKVRIPWRWDKFEIAYPASPVTVSANPFHVDSLPEETVLEKIETLLGSH